MSIKESYLFELERETNNTRLLLSRVNDEHLSFKPHEKSMSLGDLLAHVVELHNWVHRALSKDVFDFHKDYIPFKVTSVQELKDALEEGLEKNKTFLAQFEENNWFSNWSMQAGDHVIAQMPKVGTIRYVINNHLIHHRGQATVYMRMLNIPLPGLYGPSADEQQ